VSFAWKLQNVTVEPVKSPGRLAGVSPGAYGESVVAVGFGNQTYSALMGHLSQREKIGPFRLLTPLASGAMAEVWLAQRLLPDSANSPEFVSTFLNETGVAMQIHHPHIVRVFESESAEECHY
jgi:serine/threonine protein kinase